VGAYRTGGLAENKVWSWDPLSVPNGGWPVGARVGGVSRIASQIWSRDQTSVFRQHEKAGSRVEHVLLQCSQQASIVDMPPTNKKHATTRKSIYTWTTGRQRSITHVEPIGKRGFGEVHKV